MTTPTDKEKLQAIIRHLEDTPWPTGKMTTDEGRYALMVCKNNVKRAIEWAKREANK